MSNATTSQDFLGHEENLIDEDLQQVLGERYVEDIPAADYEQRQGSTESGFLDAIKWPAFFIALGAFIGWTAQMDLMDAIIAVPGMCVCSACFGWHIKK